MNLPPVIDERAEALADIKAKVRAAMERDIEWAMARIDFMADDRMHNSPCAFIADHIDNGSNVRTPKNVLCALYRELQSSRQYGPGTTSLKDTRAINKYHLYT